VRFKAMHQNAGTTFMRAQPTKRLQARLHDTNFNDTRNVNKTRNKE